jgi:hypothetical protein
MASCQALPCPVAAVGNVIFPGDVKPTGLDIWWRVDRMGTRATESYMR